MRRLALVVGVCATLAGCGSSSKTGTSAAPKNDRKAGVRITSCARDAVGGDIEIKGTAVNATSKRSDFVIDIAITVDLGRTELDVIPVFVGQVEPGQTAQWATHTAIGPTVGMACTVTAVNHPKSS